MPRQKMTANHVTDLLAEMVYSNIFKYMPLQKVAEILSKHNLCSQRKRKLPAESIVFLLVLMAINADISISSVLGKMLYPIRLILGVNEETKPPVKSAIVKARKRLTVDFFKELFETICIPQGTRENKYCFFKKYRLVAVDATVQTIQNTPQNAKKFECSTNHCGESHNPKVRITALMECGTKMFFAIKYGSYKEAEVVQYEKLIDSLSSDMLLLADRAYYNFELWQKSLERCGALIWRIKKT